MKHRILLAGILVLTMTACSSNNKDVEHLNQDTQEQGNKVTEINQTELVGENEEKISDEDFFKSYVMDFPSYQYEGKTEVIFNDRVFILEDIPENIVEELAVNNFYLDIAGEYEALAEMMGENEALTISVENEKKHFEEGIYTDKNIIHEVSILEPEDFEGKIDYFMNSLKSYIDTYDLKEYSVARVDVSWEYSEAALEKGPQLGEGRYERLYLFGKKDPASVWKMYEVYWGEMLTE